MPSPFIHVILVHFPVAILSLGWIGEMTMHFSPVRRRWLFPATSAALWIGSAMLAAAALKAIVDLPAGDLRFLLWWAAGLFAALSYWRWHGVHRVQALFAIAWLGSLIPLWAAALQEPAASRWIGF